MRIPFTAIDIKLPTRKPKEKGFASLPARIREAVAAATIGAYALLLLFCLQFVGSVKLALDISAGEQGDWWKQSFVAALNFLPLLPLIAVSLAAIRWSKVWVSLFATTPKAAWVCKWGSLFLGVLTSVVIILGSASVNQETRAEDYRGGLKTEQAAQQGKAALQAQATAIDTRLAQMRDKRINNEYAANAANVGVKRYTETYMAPAMLAKETPERRRLIERGLGAAQTADDLEAQKKILIGQIAAAPTAAETEAVVTMTDPVSKLMNATTPWRMPLLMIVVDLILIFGPFFADQYEERLAKEAPANEPAPAPQAEPAANAKPDGRSKPFTRLTLRRLPEPTEEELAELAELAEPVTPEEPEPAEQPQEQPEPVAA